MVNPAFGPASHCIGVRALSRIDDAAAIVHGLPVSTDANAFLTTFRAPLFYRMVTTRDPIDDELIAQSVRITLLAAPAGLVST